MVDRIVCRVACALVLCMSPAVAQEPAQQIPLLTAGAIPLYPPIAVIAHIQGTVKIRVTTDGNKVASLEVVSGQPMLAKYAEENIRTWEFAQHKPTTFITSFEYVIEVPAECGLRNESLVLRLPLEARITAKASETCDPVKTVKSHP